MAVTLYHPDLKETVEAHTETQADVLKKSGWTEDVPKKYQESAPSAPTTTPTEEA